MFTLVTNLPARSATRCLFFSRSSGDLFAADWRRVTREREDLMALIFRRVSRIPCDVAEFGFGVTISTGKYLCVHVCTYVYMRVHTHYMCFDVSTRLRIESILKS